MNSIIMKVRLSHVLTLQDLRQNVVAFSDSESNETEPLLKLNKITAELALLFGCENWSY